MMKQMKVDKLNVVMEETNEKMGATAAAAIAKELIELGKVKDTIRVMFAAAPSQNTTLAALLEENNVPWEKIEAFHMDEYVGISPKQSQSFRNFLNVAIFERKPFKAVHLIPADAPDTKKAAADYEALLREKPLDMVVLGIGENGHIAFNDPPFSKFDDEHYTRIIDMAERSRIQQVNDGCFEKLDDVPKSAITVTIPAFRTAGALHCVVPNSRKAQAVKDTLHGPITESCPASILRTHDNATLYIDADSASLL